MSVVLYKYLNCAVNKTTNTGHKVFWAKSYVNISYRSKTTNTGHTTNISYALIPSIMMILVISSWSKPLKTEPCYLI